jgi:hypothetical protein
MTRKTRLTGSNFNYLGRFRKASILDAGHNTDDEDERTEEQQRKIAAAQRRPPQEAPTGLTLQDVAAVAGGLIGKFARAQQERRERRKRN